MIKAWLILLACLAFGEALQRITNLPIPGSVLGMLALLLLLILKVVHVKQIEAVSTPLLKYLTLLFLPAGIVIALEPALLIQHWQVMVLVIVISTVIALPVVAALSKLLTSKTAPQAVVQNAEGKSHE